MATEIAALYTCMDLHLLQRRPIIGVTPLDLRRIDLHCETSGAARHSVLFAVLDEAEAVLRERVNFDWVDFRMVDGAWLPNSAVGQAMDNLGLSRL